MSMKKLISLCLCLMLAFSCVTVLPAARAEETQNTIESVQVNQVGYIKNLDKTFVAVRTVDDTTPVAFQLLKAGTEEEVFSGTMQKEETPYAGTENEWPNFYYTGDFTSFNTEGKYELKVTCGDETALSCAFEIGGTDIYEKPLNAILAYFRGERDTNNTQIRNQYNNNEIIDLHGAWYDASNRPAVYIGYVDNYNYMVCPVEGNTSYQLFEAYETNREYYDAIDYNHNGVADIVEEAVWGCDWYVRLKPQELTGGYFYNGPENGKVHDNESVKTPVAIRMGSGTAIAALAIAARYGIDGDFTTEEFGENARQAWDWYIENNAALACEDGMEHMMDDVYWAVAGIEMYKTFNEQKYLDKAIESIDKLLARQTGDENFDGWYELGMEEYNEKGEGGPYHNWLDEAAVLYPLIGYTELCPDDAERIAKIKASVQKYMDFKLDVSENSGANPYGYAKQYFRHDIGDENSTLTRFFQNETGRPTSGGKVTNGWTSGENGRLLSLLYASLLADEFLGTDKYLSYGINQLNWVYGVNPYYAVMQCGIGEGRNLAEEIGHGGTVPYGAFINGIRGDYKSKITYDTGYTDSKDIPFIDRSYWTGEWFLPIGTDAIMAFTKLMSVLGEEEYLQKDTPVEAEDNEYLLTVKNGVNKANKNFSVDVAAFENASGGKAVVGINDQYEGVIFANAPEATSVTLRYAAPVGGTIGLYVNGVRKDLHFAATGGSDEFDSVSTWIDIKKGDTVSVQFDAGDADISLDYVIFNDITVESIGSANITTMVNEPPVMPEAVDVVYSDGTSGREPAEWDEIDPASYAKRNTFTVKGRIVETGDEVTATVSVYEKDDAVRIKPVYSASAAGLAPKLPGTVEVYYDNGMAVAKTVTWDAIDPSKYAAPGKFTVEGAIEGLKAKAVAEVTVFEEFPEGVSDLAFGKKTSASGEYSTNYTKNAVDGDLSSRWESAVKGEEHQWLEIDLGKEYSVGSFKINWEAAYAEAYSISISSDRKTWTKIYETEASDGEIDAFNFDTVAEGRYIRLDCNKYFNTTWKGYSLYEIQIFSAPYAVNYVPASGMSIVAEKSVISDNGEKLPLSAAFTPENTSIDAVLWAVTDEAGNPTDCATIDYTGTLKAVKNGVVKVTASAVDGTGKKAEKLFKIMGQSAGNLALNKPASAMGTYTSSQGPSKAVDGDSATRWTGKWGVDDQWYQVDLGEKQDINRVTINWENACAVDYEILVSDTGADGSWTQVYNATGRDGGIEVLDFATTQARFVRVHSTKAKMNQYGISIWEFEVYNTPHVTVSAADITDAVKSLQNPAPGEATLALPQQDGFTVSIASSSNEAVIAKNGAITPAAADTEVNLTLSIVNNENPDDTQTVDVTVTVPGEDNLTKNLQKLVDDAQALNSGDYTAESFALVAAAIAGARQVLDDPSAQAFEIESMEARLSLAIDGLVEAGEENIWKTLLKQTIDAADAIVAEGFKQNIIPQIKTKFLAALAAAKELYTDPDATDEQLKAADDELILMMHYLEFTADKESLKAAIDAARDVINSGDYIKDEEMDAFIKAVDDAQALYDSDYTTDTEIGPAIDAMAEAQAALNPVVPTELDLSVLQHQINLSKNAYENLSKYFDGDAKNIFKAAYEKAVDVLAKAQAGDGAIDQAKVNEAAEALHAARAGLRLIPNKDELKNLLDNANATDFSKYTKESGAVLRMAIDAAQAVYDDPMATVEDVKAAEAVLHAAMDNLVPIKQGGAEEPGTEPPTGDATPIAGIATMLLLSAGAALLLRKRK